ncbi:hypothetical protein [Xanthobacter agilis]|uniref:Uncharacterized protein n=1 Tax=Xanthobacter agilis TaxID=47492 RepID=A0ABU0LFT7_XANAG|nr:hypothetical protein [Xanthobacter agilis]MDQ0506006.1 hypothetical protein [Xanthobacter agilis]
MSNPSKVQRERLLYPTLIAQIDTLPDEAVLAVHDRTHKLMERRHGAKTRDAFHKIVDGLIEARAHASGFAEGRRVALEEAADVAFDGVFLDLGAVKARKIKAAIRALDPTQGGE